MSVAGIREIAFHHSHASLHKYTASITSRQSTGNDDGGFWPPVSVSILIIFSPLQPDTAQAHSIPLRAERLGKCGGMGMTAERGYRVFSNWQYDAKWAVGIIRRGSTPEWQDLSLNTDWCAVREATEWPGAS